MLAAITLLLVYQLLGEVVALAFDLPIPGPVIGFAALFVTFVLRGGVSDELRETANGLLAHLSLLFVPAGVGVMAHLGRLREEWVAIVAALVLSTAITIAATALVMRALMRRQRGRRSE